MKPTNHTDAGTVASFFGKTPAPSEPVATSGAVPSTVAEVKWLV